MIKPRPINAFMRSDSVLRALHNTLIVQEKLLILTRSLLPAPLDQHCISVQQHYHNLIVHTNSSAWGSRLRYFSRDLRAKLQDKGVHVQKIEVRVLINSRQKAHIARHAHHLSEANAKLIESTADNIQDIDLRAALKRLSKHGLT